MKMIEKVARALCAANSHDPDVHFQGAPLWRLFIRLARAAIEAMREAPVTAEGWGPIESAPRDGTAILIHVGGEVPIVVYADPADDQQWRRFLGFGKSGYVGTIHTDNATHWRPLPAPPTGEGGGL